MTVAWKQGIGYIKREEIVLLSLLQKYTILKRLEMF